ncbi:MAG: hypothetical protein D6805_04155 [Planctomycetota bacterium]|nr:MAG: hypothetical protein D6805_04155 [Planctomycetota bacterium]
MKEKYSIPWPSYLIYALTLVALTSSSLQAQEEQNDKKNFPRAQVWFLEFKHQHPKRFFYHVGNYSIQKGYTMPKVIRRHYPSLLTRVEPYWYMIYTLTTYEKQPVSVFIDITAESTGADVPRLPTDGLYPPRPKRIVRYHDGYYPLVQAAIERKYKRHFWGQNDLTIPRKFVSRTPKEGAPLNLPKLGGVNLKKDAILNFTDTRTLRGKISFIDASNIEMIEIVKDENGLETWNIIPFLQSIIKNKDNIASITITKEDGDQIDCESIKEYLGGEIIYSAGGEENSIDLASVQSVKVRIDREKVESISYECIAIFKKFDLQMTKLKITIKGLTNGVLLNVESKNPPVWKNADTLLGPGQLSQEIELLKKMKADAEREKNTRKIKRLTKLIQLYDSLESPHDRILRYSVLELHYKVKHLKTYPHHNKLEYVGRNWRTYAKLVHVDLPQEEGAEEEEE